MPIRGQQPQQLPFIRPLPALSSTSTCVLSIDFTPHSRICNTFVCAPQSTLPKSRRTGSRLVSIGGPPSFETIFRSRSRVSTSTSPSTLPNHSPRRLATAWRASFEFVKNARSISFETGPINVSIDPFISREFVRRQEEFKRELGEEEGEKGLSAK